MYKEVHTEEFNETVSKNISLGRCRRCNNPGGQIVIHMPYYGRAGVEAVCPACGYKTKIHGFTVQMLDVDTNRYGTPVTDESLTDGVRKAAAEWNMEDVKQ